MNTDDLAKRIDARLPAGGYLDAETAVRDAARVTLLATVPDADRAHTVIRDVAIFEANRERARAAADPVYEVTRFHKVLMIVLLVLALLAPALILELPGIRRAAFGVQEAALPAGLLAAVCLAGFWYLATRFHRPTEPDSLVNTNSRLYAGIGGYWLLATGAIVAFRSDEINVYEPLVPVIGMVLLGGSGVGMMILWWRLRGAERAAAGTDELTDPLDAPFVEERLDTWWGTIAGILSVDERKTVREVFPLALHGLVARGALTDDQARVAEATPPWDLWAG